VLITHAAFASGNADEGAPEVADLEACEGEPAGLCTSIRRFKHVCTKNKMQKREKTVRESSNSEPVPHRGAPAYRAGVIGGGDCVVAGAAEAGVAARLQRHGAGGVEAQHAATLPAGTRSRSRGCKEQVIGAGGGAGRNQCNELRALGLQPDTLKIPQNAQKGRSEAGHRVCRSNRARWGGRPRSGGQGR
jgi:hypothetical protein